ncbi:hypothetical protein JB92DRAFT_2829563 [Gautieria morchelliformis]|nr:hypothetical protein JB92DRAFT_2829563 [Gautieria morchelliformis]
MTPYAQTCGAGDVPGQVPVPHGEDGSDINYLLDMFWVTMLREGPSIDDAQGGLVMTGCRPAKRIPVVHVALCGLQCPNESSYAAYVSMQLHITYRLLREDCQDIRQGSGFRWVGWSG